MAKRKIDSATWTGANGTEYKPFNGKLTVSQLLIMFTLALGLIIAFNVL